MMLIRRAQHPQNAFKALGLFFSSFGGVEHLADLSCRIRNFLVELGCKSQVRARFRILPTKEIGVLYNSIEMIMIAKILQGAAWLLNPTPAREQPRRPD